MGEMASSWGYAEQEDMEELGQKLLYTTLELEKLKSETMEEMQKNKDYVNQLIVLLKCAIQERDEARKQLQKLINTTNSDTFPLFQPNSSITESNSLSETYSPPVDSFFDPPEFDQGSLIIDSLVKGRVLPQKGMFLQAVTEAGPLLQTLLVAGPLPRWRNPPQMQAFQIPPVVSEKPASSGYANFGGVRNNDCFGLGKRHRFC